MAPIAEYHMNHYLEDLGPDAPFASVQELATTRGAYSSHLVETPNSLFRTLRGDIAPESDALFAGFQSHREEVREEVQAGFIEAMDA